VWTIAQEETEPLLEPFRLARTWRTGDNDDAAEPVREMEFDLTVERREEQQLLRRRKASKPGHRGYLSILPEVKHGTQHAAPPEQLALQSEDST
jgi:hypothetical protein